MGNWYQRSEYADLLGLPDKWEAMTRDELRHKCVELGLLEPEVDFFPTHSTASSSAQGMTYTARTQVSSSTQNAPTFDHLLRHLHRLRIPHLHHLIRRSSTEPLRNSGLQSRILRRPLLQQFLRRLLTQRHLLLNSMRKKLFALLWL